MSRVRALVTWVAMILFGFATYVTLGQVHGPEVARTPARPLPSSKPAVILPGVIYVASQGTLYRFQTGAFTQVGTPAGWMQPVLAPDGGHLVAVKRSGNVSDLYQLGLDGTVQKQLTRNASGIVEVNHWAFYPRFSPDGSQLFLSTDKPKVYDYRVDLAVWSMAAGGGAQREWTEPNYYTGGDVQPVPLANGGLLYTKYAVDDAGQSVSSIYLAPRAMAAGSSLTAPGDRCAQPTLSPDATELAMICMNGARDAQLVMAPFDGRGLGQRTVLVEGILATAPAWAPDGSGLVFLAPGADDAGGRFQLWWVRPGAAAVQVTRDADLDALSAPAWAR